MCCKINLSANHISKGVVSTGKTKITCSLTHYITNLNIHVDICKQEKLEALERIPKENNTR